MGSVFTSFSEKETKKLANELVSLLGPGLVTLHGELGAGKTCLSGGILQALGAEGPYQSPTFVLMKEYELPEITQNGIKRILHTDAYRVESVDFESLGFREWLEDQEALILLEWPEKIADILPKERTEISIQIQSDGSREISVKTV